MVSMKHPRLVLFSAVLLALPLAAQVKITPAVEDTIFDAMREALREARR